MTEKNYFLFYGEDYYPCGGIRDLKGSFPSVEDAIKSCEDETFDWAHITDKNFEVVKVFAQFLESGKEVLEKDAEDYIISDWKDGGLDKEKLYKRWYE